MLLPDASPSIPYPPTAGFGPRLRHWRLQRGLSQQALSLMAEVSARHLSYLETERALPSRDMVLRLAERLDVPWRERNGLLTSAGYAPLYRERDYAHPDMAAARSAVELVLRCHEPFPALAVDRHWNMVACNRLVPVFMQGLPDALLQPPVNVLRLSLHPQGLAPRIQHFDLWREHLLHRVAQQLANQPDPVLAALLSELRAYGSPPVPPDEPAPALPAEAWAAPGVVLPFQLRSEHGLLSFFSTVTVFGSALDITLKELTLETFFPADAATQAVLTQLSAASA